jgi:hypothetical protein
MMKKPLVVLILILLMSAGMAMPTSGAENAITDDGPTSLTGQWHGPWSHFYLGYASIFSMYINQEYGYVIINLPEAGLFNQPLLATFGVNSITIVAGVYTFAGSLTGNSISGGIWSGGYQIASWQIFSEIDDLSLPAPDPDTTCDELPEIYTVGDYEYCGELLPFDPDFGPGYIDYPENGETWENQYRSYARRDLIQLVKYATAKVECITSEWDYWDFAPLGLIDMSETDGSIPGTSVGYPGHPPGTHENGNDMDLAYYQLYTPDNQARSIGVHFDFDGYTDAFHLTEEPTAIDPWRTALFIAYLSEHHHVRVIGVDGQVGLVLEEALDDLVELGYIDADHRESIPLAYEVENQGYGWYYFHHHHMHVSMKPFYDMISDVDITPETLNRKSQGKYITGYIELYEYLDINDLDISTVKLVVDGHTVVPVSRAQVSDYNDNGIPDLTVKFDRQLVAVAIDTGTVEVGITGAYYGQYYFQESDTISVHK